MFLYSNLLIGSGKQVKVSKIVAILKQQKGALIILTKGRPIRTKDVAETLVERLRSRYE